MNLVEREVVRAIIPFLYNSPPPPPLLELQPIDRTWLSFPMDEFLSLLQRWARDDLSLLNYC